MDLRLTWSEFSHLVASVEYLLNGIKITEYLIWVWMELEELKKMDRLRKPCLGNAAPEPPKCYNSCLKMRGKSRPLSRSSWMLQKQMINIERGWEGVFREMVMITLFTCFLMSHPVPAVPYGAFCLEASACFWMCKVKPCLSPHPMGGLLKMQLILKEVQWGFASICARALWVIPLQCFWAAFFHITRYFHFYVQHLIGIYI